MTTTTLGQSAKNAIRFVQRIHQDTCALLQSLDEQLGQKGLQPTNKQIAVDLSQCLKRDSWVAAQLFRLYVPADEIAATTRAFACHILFNPDTHDEPIVLFAALDFPKPTSPSVLWEEWLPEGSDRVLKAFSGSNNRIELDGKRLKPHFFPDASKGTAFVVPLCEITSEEDLGLKIVVPLLKLLK